MDQKPAKSKRILPVSVDYIRRIFINMCAYRAAVQGRRQTLAFSRELPLRALYKGPNTIAHRGYPSFSCGGLGILTTLKKGGYE